MAHDTNTLASWAELVPDAKPCMTVDDLLALPDDGRWQYEVVEGRLVRIPGSGLEASNIAILLSAALVTWVLPRQLGRVTGADGTYNLTQPGDPGETGLVPDLAFVAAHRLPPRQSADFAKAPHLAPDLVAEVASPSQFRPEMRDKAEWYIEAGARLVWVIWPKRQQVDVWRPDAAGQTGQGATAQLVATLKASADDVLDGLDVLPGFTHPLAALFV